MTIEVVDMREDLIKISKGEVTDDVWEAWCFWGWSRGSDGWFHPSPSREVGLVIRAALEHDQATHGEHKIIVALTRRPLGWVEEEITRGPEDSLGSKRPAVPSLGGESIRQLSERVRKSAHPGGWVGPSLVMDGA
ncbi:hypothetical protein HY389_00345 [Candidatus Daviesbacteria bacterium]|nr:hypothetical protein [Candidatus Daviesbacteria bacterium]